MSSVALVSFRAPALAWTDSSEDQRLFRLVTGAVLTVTAVMCLVLLLSPVPKADRSQPQALPTPMAKLLLEHNTPPPEPIKPKVEPDNKPEPKPESKAETLRPQDNKPVPAKVAPQRQNTRVDNEPRPAVAAVPEAPPVDNQAMAVEAARRKVAGLGLLAARDDIAQVRGTGSGVSIKTDIRQGSGVGGAAVAGVGPSGDAGSLARSMITSNSSGGSGIVNTAGAARNVNGGGLAGRATTVVVDDSRARALSGPGAAPKHASSGGSAGKPPRTSEEIRLVMARTLGALNAIYARALRADPTIPGGQFLVEIKVAPTGEVLDCKVLFSQLQSPELEAKLKARIKMIDFGSKDVDVTVEKYQYDFTP